ncbi:MAG: lasso peptide biosynthesis B2 protein, partial [Steroidobacteraceae bacterium]
AHPVGRWVKGWPIPASRSTAPPQDAGSPARVVAPENGLLAKMLSQGLLVRDPTVGKAATPVVTEQPTVAMVEFDLHVRPRATFAQLRHFFTAYTAAKWALKHRPMKEVVRAAELRKKRAPATAALDSGAVRPLVTAFIHLRPLFFTSRNACLLDSLTLVHFLARYSVFPQWVFGVKTDPFYAHCWVQEGDSVFNDTPDHVIGFTPILVV